MHHETEDEILRQQGLEDLRNALEGALANHRDREPKLMDIFESLALKKCSVFDLSVKYGLSEEDVRNAYGRAASILRNEHGSLRRFLGEL